MNSIHNTNQQITANFSARGLHMYLNTFKVWSINLHLLHQINMPLTNTSSTSAVQNAMCTNWVQSFLLQPSGNVCVTCVNVNTLAFLWMFCKLLYRKIPLVLSHYLPRNKFCERPCHMNVVILHTVDHSRVNNLTKHQKNA